MNCTRRRTSWQCKETLLGRGAQAESRRVRETGRTAPLHGSEPQVFGDGLHFCAVFGQSFRVLPGGPPIGQARWMPARRILGGGRAHGISFWPFPNSWGWWWLISSVFLTRTYCCKITHSNCYYGAWPGWVISVNVTPNCFVFKVSSELPFPLPVSTI